jgi:hypothetical protein
MNERNMESLKYFRTEKRTIFAVSWNYEPVNTPGAATRTSEEAVKLTGGKVKIPFKKV